LGGRPGLGEHLHSFEIQILDKGKGDTAVTAQSGRFSNVRTRAVQLWKAIKIAGVVVLAGFALFGAGTAYAETRPKEPVDPYAQIRQVSGLAVDIGQEGKPLDGVPDLLVVVTRVTGVLENIDDGTFTLQVEAVTIPPLP